MLADQLRRWEYLAGAVLYELVVGHPPHAGTTPIAMIASIIVPGVPDPRDERVELRDDRERAGDGPIPEATRRGDRVDRQ